MPLPSGSRLGVYEVTGLIGSGGMGEVYRARDAMLRRDVAIKIVSPHRATSAGFARFEREARALAALNHPQIASVYGVAEGAGTRGLVMELVEGPTLRQCLDGPERLTTDRVLNIARQLIDAIEAAHDRGIVHRDLKPANIKITAGGTVKVLDFGLAKALSAEGTETADEATTIERTEEGVVLGTAAYMSPEQARGQTVDTRTDIWAFGAVVYELFARRKAFDGETTTDVLAAVLTKDPDWRALSSDVPPSIARLLRRCLQKDPARRLRHIGDARFEFDEIGSTSTVGAPTSARAGWARPWMIVAALAIGAALALAAAPLVLRMLGRSAQSHDEPAVFGVSEPPGSTFNLFEWPIRVSPDGTRIAMVLGSLQGKRQIWLRALDSPITQPLDGTEQASYPFWSPDSRAIGFFSNGQLRVIDLVTRSVRVVAPWAGVFGGGSWNRDDVIVFADGPTGLKRVLSTGGEVRPVTTVDNGGGELFHGAPCFLPDNRHFLYVRALPTGARMFVGALDSADKKSLPIETPAIFAEPGYLLYGRAGELIAQQFDAARLELIGDPVAVTTGVWLWNSGGLTVMSASTNGTLALAARQGARTELTWFDRTGRATGTLAEPAEWVHVAVSPDERLVAAERVDARTGVGQTWIIDAARNVSSRLNQDPGWSLAPTWSPNSESILFGSTRTGALTLARMAIDGSGGEQMLLGPEVFSNPTDWRSDGRIIFTNLKSTGPEIQTLLADGDKQPRPVAGASIKGTLGRISPDGRWLAYVSEESGRSEVVVRALSGGGRWPISRNGGTQPRWRHDGKELFFLTGDGTLMAVAITATVNAIQAGEPEDLHIAVQKDLLGSRFVYDVAGVPARFLVSRPTTSDRLPTTTVVLHWPSLLKKHP